MSFSQCWKELNGFVFCKKGWQVRNFCKKKTCWVFFNAKRRSIGSFFANNTTNDEELEKYRKRKIKRKNIKVCKKNPLSFSWHRKMFNKFFFLQREPQMAKIAREDKEEDKGKKGSRINSSSFNEHFNITRKDKKKWKLDLTFLRMFYLSDLSVEKATESSSCDSSSRFSSLKSCLLSWCNATSFSFNGNPL